MSFKLYENNGVWTVSREDAYVMIEGGVPISYEMYQKLKDAPHDAQKYYGRDTNNNLVLLNPPNKT